MLNLRIQFFKFAILVFILMNIIAIFYAYKFTHFADENIVKTAHPEKLSISEKLKTIIFGIDNPRPKTIVKPSQEYRTTILPSNKKIEIWEIDNHSIPIDSVKGTVIIFHGYSGCKSKMSYLSDNYQELGYHTVLVDFMGSGGSEGSQTTIGYLEAEQVKTVYKYIQSKKKKNIILAGTSMGAVAIMKSIHDFHLEPSSIVLECPFGSMYQTVAARFLNMNAPSFPMAGMLVFWGGAINGFWGFGHNPIEYASSISCPTLLLYGEKDINVSRDEIDEIYQNLNGKKQLILYPNHGHERLPKMISKNLESIK